MIDRARKRKKQVRISEDDVATVLERYSATAVLALLKEVSQFADGKLDWKELVKNTQTGISNAREYQMLWRHLAYRQSLLDDKLEDGAEPLDDDSDLEVDLAAFPPASHEATTEAAACVRVMMESGLSDSGHPSCSMVEAPLTINIPNGQSFRAPIENLETPCSMQGRNIIVPVCVQKQPVPGVTSNEGLDTNGSGCNMPPRRKRKPWTEAEDLELMAAVEQCGEGNWANIVKGNFKGGRTASQLSQRWTIIRKKKGNVNVGGGNPSSEKKGNMNVGGNPSSEKKGNMNVGGNPSSGPKLSEALLATRNAVNLALSHPAKNITSPSSVGSGLNVTSRNFVHPSNAKACSSLQAVHPSQQAGGTGLNGAPSNSVCPNVEASSSAQAVNQSEQAETGSNTIVGETVRPNAETSGFAQVTNQSKQGLNATSSDSVNPPNVEVGSRGQAAHQSQQGLIPSKSPTVGALGLSAKSRVIAKKILTKPVFSSDSMVKATAVAAGARIATQSVADSVIKAAKNVHIMPTSGGSLMKSAMSSGATTHLPGHPNVHYICTGLSANSHPTYPSTTSSVPRSVPTRSAPLAIQRMSSIALPSMISKQTTAVPSSVSVEHTANQHVKTGKEIKVYEMDNVPKEQLQGDSACVAGDLPSNKVKEDKASLSNQGAGLKEETTVDDLSNLKATDSDVGAALGEKAELSQSANPNSNKAEINQDPKQKKNSHEESQDASQKMNKGEVGEDSKDNEALESQDGNHNSNKASESQDANQNSNKVEVNQDPSQKKNSHEQSLDASQKMNKAEVGEDAKNDNALESQDANRKNNIVLESQDGNHNSNKALGSKDANQKNNKTLESQDGNQNSNKALENQDANQNSNKALKSQDANQNSNKAEERRAVNQKNSKAEEIRSASQTNGKVEDHNSQAANQTNEMGGSQINARVGGESLIENCDTESILSMAADGTSGKLEIVCKATACNKV